MWSLALLGAVAVLLLDLLCIVEVIQDDRQECYKKYLAKKDRRRIKSWQTHCRK